MKEQSAQTSPPPQRSGFSFWPLRRSLILLWGAILLVLGGVNFSCERIQQALTAAAQRKSAEQLVFELNEIFVWQYAATASWLARTREVISTSTHRLPPDSDQLLPILNTARHALGAEIVYIMDRQGEVRGCSPYANNKTLTGNNYHFRPYFQQAVMGKASRYAGVGVTTKDRGIYFSEPVYGPEGVIPVGVLVIKTGLGLVETRMAARSEAYQSALMTDDGIILAASRDSWLFKAALPLQEEKRQQIIASRQFSDLPLEALPTAFDRDVISLDGSRMLVLRHEVNLPGWQLVTLAPLHFPFILALILSAIVLLVGLLLSSVTLKSRRERHLTEALHLGRRQRQDAEQARDELYRELSATLDASLVGIALIREGVVVNCNRMLADMLDFSQEEMAGSDVRSFFPSADAYRHFVRRYARMLTVRDIENVEYPLRKKSGDTLLCRLSGKALEVKDPNRGAVWVVEDITGRKEVERALMVARAESERASLAKSEFLANVAELSGKIAISATRGASPQAFVIFLLQRVDSQSAQRERLIKPYGASAQLCHDSAEPRLARFCAIMSHEIRTPMNGIIGLTRLALQTELHGDQRKFLTLVLSSAERLLGILNGILDFSKGEAGRLEIEAIPFSLREAVEEVIEGLACQARDKKLDLGYQVAPQVEDRLLGDRSRLQQILLNLVSNAVKFTDQGGVQLHVDRLVQQARGRTVLLFMVSDSGIGIPLEKQQTIFEPFTQADSSHARKYGGTGLGLSITRQLVCLMGGELLLESEEGKGATFLFSLPFALEGALVEERKQVESAGEEVLPPPGQRLQGHVLLVEDEFINTTLALELLQRYGLSVVCAENGREAIDAWHRERFDCILMDIQMPEMDGFQAVAKLRALEQGAGRIPVIAMTAHAMSGDEEKCLQAGMDDYIMKPIDFEGLHRVLSRYLKPGEARG